jgi:hypothetical protein
MFGLKRKSKFCLALGRAMTIISKVIVHVYIVYIIIHASVVVNFTHRFIVNSHLIIFAIMVAIQLNHQTFHINIHQICGWKAINRWVKFTTTDACMIIYTIYTCTITFEIIVIARPIYSI